MFSRGCGPDAGRGRDTLTRGFLIEKRLLASRISRTGSRALRSECGFEVGILGSGGIFYKFDTFVFLDGSG